MAYSYVRYSGNGSTTNYTFSFPTISTDHIKVRVNGTLVTNWSFLNSSTIQFAAAPASGAVIEIRRETPKDSTIVNFTDGSVLLERDLDLLATWQLYLGQETEDDIEDTIRVDSQSRFDAQNRRIINVADPINAQDAVTKVYADAVIGQATAAASAAAAVQVALAADEAVDSAASALAAASSATAAGTSATNAASSASAAAASYDSFDDRYLGAKAVAPTADNDGQALITGTIYWDTPSSQMFTWNGSAWRPTFLIGNTVRSVVTATAGQTVVATPTYLIGSNTLQVFVNGVKVLLGSDYTETTQNSITFVAGLNVSDEVELISQQSFLVDELRADLASGVAGKGVDLVAGAAKAAGSASQVFNVANATSASNALPLGQADGRYASWRASGLIVPRAKPSAEFAYVPGNIFECVTSGQAKHDIDLEWEFRTTYASEMGYESGPPGVHDVWVDPVNGLDTNSGSLHSPLKTLKKAYQSVFGTVWLKPGRYTEKLDIRNTDRTLGSGQSRAVMVKPWEGPGTVTFVGAGQQAKDMTWTANGSTWEATPSGGEIVSLILFINGSEEIPIQYKTTAAGVSSTAYGWYQDPTTKKISIRYENRDLSVDKAKFEILYQTPGDSIIYGAKVYMENITFRGGNVINVIYQGAVRPIFYAKGCTFEYLAGANVHTEGAICFTQNCVSRRSLVNDGFNYYDNAGTPTQALEIDNVCIENGVPEAAGFVNFPSNQTRNKQGSSGHETTRVCRINGVYAGNYGQNIADTGANSYTWMVGSICENPRNYLDQSATPGGYFNLWQEGTVWLDNVKSGGRLSTYGLWVQSGTTYTYRCAFSGTTAAIGGPGSRLAYVAD